MGFNKSDYIWTDRKRFLGMPLSFTRYAISDDRLFVSIGFLNIKDDEILLYRIRDITTSRTLWQRIFGVGSITVVSSDKTLPTLVLKNVKKPMLTKELLHKQVEEMKIQRRVRVGEIMASSYDDSDDDLDLDDENN
jgi:uncharacterized membrane protein YdbT with pleckstrin-like domain